MNFIRKILFIFILFNGLNCWAQPSRTFAYLKFDAEQGLPGTSVYGIIQDQNGYIWVGTDMGLVRFDGTRFKTDLIQGPIKSKIIERIYALGGDEFLMSGSFPNQIYRIRNQISDEYPLGETSLKYANRVCQSDIDQSVVVWQQNRIYQLNENGFKLVFQISDFPMEKITYVHNFKKDSLWITTDSKTIILSNNKVYPQNFGSVDHLLNSGDSTFLFVKNQIMVLKNMEKTNLAQIPNDHIQVRYALADSKNNIWFSGEHDGLYILQNGVVKDVAESLGLLGEQITYLYLDYFNNVWISTATSGLYCIQESNFINYSKVDGLSSNNITSLCGWKGKIYAGTNNGLNELSDEGIISGSNLAFAMHECQESKNAYNGYIHTLLSHGNKLMFSSDRLKKGIPNCESSQAKIISGSAALLVEDSLIVGHWGTLVCKIGTNTLYPRYVNKRLKLPCRKEFCIFKQEDGSLLVGTSNGLYKTSISLTHWTKIELPFGPSDLIVYDILLDDYGGLWLATPIGLLYKDETNQWHKYTTTDGLTSNIIRSIEWDNAGRLWIGTPNGLNVLKHGLFTVYTKGTGLVSNTIKDLYYSELNNTLWIGTNKGISSLNLMGMNEYNKKSFPLNIVGLEVVGDTTFKPGDLASLESNQNNIRIHFAGINYNNPTEVLYQYRFRGRDSGWHTTKSNYSEFMSLAPGVYNFEVRSKRASTMWGEITALSFQVSPPFWLTKSFVGFMILIFITLSWLFFAYRLKLEKRRQRLKNELLNRVSYLEQQALNLSMNPHFIFNTLNSIQHFFSSINHREAIEYIADFAELVRLNLESTKKKNINLKEEIRRITLYLSLEKSRFDKKLEYKISYSDDLALEEIEIPNMLIQPLIENAIWHGILPSEEDGLIQVTFTERSENFIQVMITDNGVGLSATQKNRKVQHTSMGLAITKERLKHLSKDNFFTLEELFDADQNPIGTRATIGISV